MDNTKIDLVDYSRQAELDSTLGIETETAKQNSCQVIIGCGGVGYWLGIFLAMMGFHKFILVDGDKLDNSNLNRIPVPQGWIGHNKAIALRRAIRQFRPDTVVQALPFHASEESFEVLKRIMSNYISGVDTFHLWDTTDDARAQQKIRKVFSNTNYTLRYRKLGYEGWRVGTYKEYDVWIDESGYAPGYRTSNANAVTSALSAGLGLFSGLLGTPDKEIDLKDLLTKE